MDTCTAKAAETDSASLKITAALKNGCALELDNLVDFGTVTNSSDFKPITKWAKIICHGAVTHPKSLEWVWEGNLMTCNTNTACAEKYLALKIFQGEKAEGKLLGGKFAPYDIDNSDAAAKTGLPMTFTIATKNVTAEGEYKKQITLQLVYE